MQRAAGICPSIVRIIQIVRTSLVARNCPNAPVVPTELKGSYWGELLRSGAFYNLYESYGTTLRGRYI